jgi:hypothetical protein
MVNRILFFYEEKWFKVPLTPNMIQSHLEGIVDIHKQKQKKVKTSYIHSINHIQLIIIEWLRNEEDGTRKHAGHIQQIFSQYLRQRICGEKLKVLNFVQNYPFYVMSADNTSPHEWEKFH